MLRLSNVVRVCTGFAVDGLAKLSQQAIDIAADLNRMRRSAKVSEIPCDRPSWRKAQASSLSVRHSCEIMAVGLQCSNFQHGSWGIL